MKVGWFYYFDEQNKQVFNMKKFEQSGPFYEVSLINNNQITLTQINTNQVYRYQFSRNNHFRRCQRILFTIKFIFVYKNKKRSQRERKKSNIVHKSKRKLTEKSQIT
ncbi:hypothetical protein TTHERM_000703759 (macronuclear) [Tetrahymena thermophila SB210]|uniref:Uncharacterized protein n=1 Tax=Tetrahymena thermophila (strain SB210) TaxID=312017 RepID=W7XDN6_TETTS|nr:hypothetical protein TTHERM_000703759 [Tetrahymena thermophila SB210]EWS71956.1 hypothetical protein TTHERM_000703759 [Tetrahymena thermophila SB210]|eukprot:XP_012655516.1 hypothetical protein TTHERM_000703759 [Tetrahymena thermophila SB210]